MPLFSRKTLTIEDTQARSDRACEKNGMTLSCPECGFEQREPKMAVSTFCKGCSTHYQIMKGQAVARKTRPSNPFASLKDDGASPRLRDNNTPTDTKDKTTIEPVSSTTPKRSSASPSESPTVNKAAGKKTADKTHFFNNRAKHRDVACFECDRVHQAPPEASSTLCPACGFYISLKNFEIRENWNQGIQTRGNVNIHKKASISGITIRCHHLTAHGKLTGNVDCSGDVTIESHGKIMGNVKCKRLIIVKRAHVEFTKPVHCEDAIIDGEVTGNFTCTGKLHLKKKATLNGDIKVASMAIDEGARHHGQISIGS